MNDEALVKITAIIGLVVLEVANLLTKAYDGGLLLAIGSVIGGLAGYHVGKTRAVRKLDQDSHS